MTSYAKTTWTNETPATSPVKYKITDDSSGVLANSAKIELVTSVTPGTAINATNLNHLETGVFNAQEDATAGLAAAAAAQSTANTANTTAGNAIPKSIVTAAGDLIIATGNSILARLAKGTVNGSVLSMSSSGNVIWDKALGAAVSTAYSNVVNNINTENVLSLTSLYANGLSVGSTTITIPTGLGSNLPYAFTQYGRFDTATANGSNYVFIQVNSSTQRTGRDFFAPSGSYVNYWTQPFSGVLILSPGDTVSIAVSQESSGTHNYNGFFSLFLIR